MLPEGERSGIYLLTSGKSNSLAASLEILSYLRQQGLKGRGAARQPEYLSSGGSRLEQVAPARKKLQGMRIGVIGQPSDWLIASHADPMAVTDKLGARLVEIPMEELLQEIAKAPPANAPAR